MAFGARNKGSMDTYNAKYSRVLGSIYLESEGVKSVLSTLPDEVKRAGYIEKTAKDLRKKIHEAGGLTDTLLEGKLAYFDVTKGTDAKGIEREYIKVGIQTEVPNEKGELKPSMVFLSVPAKSDEGLALTHKLVNAKFGEDVRLSMFAKEEKGADERIYANHKVGLKQDGKTVEPALVMDADARNKIRQDMKADGADNEDIRKALLNKEMLLTRPQFDIIKGNFNTYREERKAMGHDDDEHEQHAAASQPESLPNEAASSAAAPAPASAMEFDDDL